MNENRTFVANAHTLSGDIVSARVQMVDGGFPVTIEGNSFRDYRSELVWTFHLGRKQDPNAESAEYYLEHEDPADLLGRDLTGRV